jgi:hypothetical protein
MSKHWPWLKGPLSENTFLPVRQPFCRKLWVFSDSLFVYVHLFPTRLGPEPAVLDHFEEKRRPWVRGSDVEQSNIQGQLLSEVDDFTNSSLDLSGQADDEIAPILDAGFFRPAQHPLDLLQANAFMCPL